MLEFFPRFFYLEIVEILYWIPTSQYLLFQSTITIPIQNVFFSPLHDKCGYYKVQMYPIKSMFLELTRLTKTIHAFGLCHVRYLFLKKAKVFAHSLSDLLNNVWYMVFEIFEREFGGLISPSFDHVIQKMNVFFGFVGTPSSCTKLLRISFEKEESKLNLVVPKVHFCSLTVLLRKLLFSSVLHISIRIL